MFYNKISIAILGSRGIPASYGGFETITEELSVGLAKKGFTVFVACESNFFKKNPFRAYKGVYLVYFPIIKPIRIISEVLYDILSIIWASLKVDIICMLGYASTIALIFPKILRKTIIVNVNGLEYRRRKFNRFLRFLLKCFEMLNVKISDYVIVDSLTMGAYYQRNYKIKPVYIPNGIREIKPYSYDVLEKFGLKKDEYYLVVARLERENNVDLIIKGFKMSNSSKKLVIIGPLKKTKYVNELLKAKDKKILFLGGIYNRKLLMMFRHNCFAYIHGHEVGGTNPSLVEALSCSNAVLALDVPFNVEVAKNAALYFKKDPVDLKEKIMVIENDVAKLYSMRKEAYNVYKREYTADHMVSAFEKLLAKVYKEQGQIALCI
jgi:rhamnosyltransferase